MGTKIENKFKGVLEETKNTITTNGNANEAIIELNETYLNTKNTRTNTQKETKAAKG